MTPNMQGGCQMRALRNGSLPNLIFLVDAFRDA